MLMLALVYSASQMVGSKNLPYTSGFGRHSGYRGTDKIKVPIYAVLIERQKTGFLLILTNITSPEMGEDVKYLGLVTGCTSQGTSNIVIE